MPAKRALWLFAALALPACGMRGQQEATRAIEPHARTDETALAEQGHWLFDRPLDGLSSREHYILQIAFTGEKGEVTAHSHFNGFAWRDGIRVRLRRDGKQMSVAFGAPGFVEQAVALPQNWLSEDGQVGLRIEIHNSTAAGPRFLLWNYNVSLQGEQERPRNFVSAGNADVDSLALKIHFPSHGRGARWGVEFNQARILQARREAPYVP